MHKVLHTENQSVISCGQNLAIFFPFNIVFILKNDWQSMGKNDCKTMGI